VDREIRVRAGQTERVEVELAPLSGEDADPTATMDGPGGATP